MNTILELIDEADLCALPFLILILVVAGGAMAGGNQTVHVWGKRVAAAAFVAYCVYGAMTFRPVTAEDWIWVAVRGVLAAGLSLGVAWIALAVGDFAFRRTLATPVTKIRQWRQAAKERRAKRRAAREEEAKRRREQVEWERTRPEREQAQREADTRASAEQKDRTQAQKRREIARMDCELLWIAYAPAIQQQFGKQDLEAFLTKYIADSQPPEFVEERAAALKATLTTLYTNAEPTKKYKSVEEAIVGFDRAKERIDREHFEDPDFQEYLKLELDKIKAQHLAAVIKNMGV